MTMLELAIRYACGAHAGIPDKSGLPQILHPLRVMLHPSLTREDQRIIAVLHDTVEDTDATLEDILDKFGLAVCSAVDALSRQEDENYRSYIRRVRIHPVARVIKVVDIHDNLCRPTPGGLGTLRSRYEKALEVLLP